jgi:hypothetical protein
MNEQMLLQRAVRESVDAGSRWLTPKLSAARHGCRTAKALYLSGFTHLLSPKLPPRVRCSLLLGDSQFRKEATDDSRAHSKYRVSERKPSLKRWAVA